MTPSSNIAVAEIAARPAEPPALEIAGLGRTFVRASGEVVPAVDDVSLEVARGEFVVLLGPSGCGKTTLLRCIAGLETPDRGTIRTFGQTVYSPDGGVVPAERRSLGMVFQSYALWPHLTAVRNVAYPLRFGRAGKANRPGRREAREKAIEALAKVGIESIADQYPAQMSGGQQQRVALARAIVDGRRLILFDEPLSNVDARERERERLRLELAAMHRDLGFTAIYVTHDQVEALELADRIVVMRDGRIEQTGTPHEIYLDSRSRYVANFLGSTNELPAEVVGREAGGVVVSAAGAEWAVDGVDDPPGTSGVLIIRPEHVVVRADGDAGPLDLPAVVVASNFLGAYGEALLQLDSGVSLMIRTPAHQLPETGATLRVVPDGPAKFFAEPAT